MYAWLRKTLVERLELPSEGISPEANAKDAGLDSLAVIELAMIAKAELGIDVEEDAIHELETIAEVTDYLAGHQQPVVR